MTIDIIFRLAGIGIIVAVITQLLKQTGRDEIALLVTIAGLVIALMTAINVISTLFDSVKRIFTFY